jgi:hypothetical protein
VKNLTFCIILISFSMTSYAANIKFKSPELQKLHEIVKDIKTIPLLNVEICKVNLDKELIKPEVKMPVEEEIFDRLKVQVSEKEQVDIGNIHTLKELFDHTNFSSFSGVLDNTFCFVNLPNSKIGTHEDRVKLFETIKEISTKIKFAVLLDDGYSQGTDVTKLYVYGVDPSSEEAFAIKSQVE